MASQIKLNFSVRLLHVKGEIEKRAAEMDMTAAKYCIMVLARHVASGERFRVADGQG